MISNVESVMDKIFSSESLTKEFEGLKNLEEVFEFLKKQDRNIELSDVVIYIKRLIGLNDDAAEKKLDADDLEMVSGGRMINNKKFLASALGALTIATSAGVGTNADALWDKMSTGQKVATVGVGITGLAVLATVTGVLIHSCYQRNKEKSNIDRLKSELSKLDGIVEQDAEIRYYRNILIEAERLQSENIKLDEDINSSMAKISDLQKHIQSLNQSIETLSMEIPILKDRLAKLEVVGELDKREHDKLTIKYRSLSDIHDNLVSRRNQLQNYVNSLKNKAEAENAAIRQQEEQRRQERARKQQEEQHRQEQARQQQEEQYRQERERKQQEEQYRQERERKQQEEQRRKEEQARKQQEEQRRQERERKKKEEEQRQKEQQQAQEQYDENDYRQRAKKVFGVELKEVDKPKYW